MGNCIKEKNIKVNVSIKNLGPRGPEGPQGPKGDPGNVKPYISLRRLSDYLYEITFDKLPEYIPTNEFNPFGCSSFVKNGMLHRNLDWYYGKTAEFKINFGNVEGMAFKTGLNAGELLNQDDALGQLPYQICDGINEHGICVSTHVLFNDFDYIGSGNKNIDLTLLPFMVLTTMDSVSNISEEVQNLLDNVYLKPGLVEQELLIQVLVTDGTTTMLFTPTESGYEYIDISSNPKVTNFKWVNRKLVNRSDSDIQTRPTGIERWNLIEDGASLEDLRFTLAYQTNARLSEFIGIDGTTKDSTDAELQAIYERAHAEYAIRQRNNVLWQTVHSIIYSDSKIEELYVQENYKRSFVY